MRSSQEWQEVGERIRRARTARGVSQGDLAVSIELDRTAIVRLEAGERALSALELGRLARALQVPLPFFVSEPSPAMASHRSGLLEEISEEPVDQFLADVALEDHARDTSWLVEAKYLAAPHAHVSGGVGTPEEARQLARDARRAIGIESGPLPGMADVCERLGLFLLVIPGTMDGASMFIDTGTGVAVTGADARPGRRRMTAAHELGHHLVGDEYQSDIGVAASRSERERVIDEFARELLLPQADVVATFSAAPDVDPWTSLVTVAAQYRVSWAVAVLTARDASFIDDEAAKLLRARPPVRGDLLASGSIEPTEDLRLGETGPRWRRAVLSAYVAGAITAARAVQMLKGALAETDLPIGQVEALP